MSNTAGRSPFCSTSTLAHTDLCFLPCYWPQILNDSFSWEESFANPDQSQNLEIYRTPLVLHVQLLPVDSRLVHVKVITRTHNTGIIENRHVIGCRYVRQGFTVEDGSPAPPTPQPPPPPQKNKTKKLHQHNCVLCSDSLWWETCLNPLSTPLNNFRPVSIRLISLRISTLLHLEPPTIMYYKSHMKSRNHFITYYPVCNGQYE